MDAMAGLTAGTVASSGGTVGPACRRRRQRFRCCRPTRTTVTAGTSVVQQRRSCRWRCGARAGDDATVATGSARNAGSPPIVATSRWVPSPRTPCSSEAPGDVTGTAMHVGSHCVSPVPGVRFGFRWRTGRRRLCHRFRGRGGRHGGVDLRRRGRLSLGFWGRGHVTIPAGTFGAANSASATGGFSAIGNPGPVDQHDKSIQAADVQLRPRGSPFYLYLTGNRVRDPTPS